MNESEYLNCADAMLEHIVAAIETAKIDCECEYRGDGILEIEFDNDSKVIINRNTSARQIWLAASSGGFHFRWAADQWVDTRDGVELSLRLSQILSDTLGEKISIPPL